ncbi:sigma-70 family RNA polymerase sigma factor [Vallitalea pronyensis]|uniref:Sigma-70 family RNA polymerase sigma factor n=1 Tax=Vallitalea pronyensis TaxID=1348613 RepID=A0A8J8MN43_9FIRM|nr:sigma-70 family RNA polymerase sigma factor [Vallitalea pronyensis]QUI24501.1 sigma-70 family RNA polymerase sigma factor [Vallitalea pronyensis]
MRENISELVEESKIGNRESLWKLIQRFSPLIGKYSRILRYEDAKNDIIEHFIRIIKQMPLMSEGKEIKYINNSIRNISIKLSKRSSTYEDNILLNDQMEYFQSELRINGLSIDMESALKSLEDKARKIICYRYILGYSDTEISNKVSISRQAVHKARKKALTALRCMLGGEGYGK